MEPLLLSLAWIIAGYTTLHLQLFKHSTIPVGQSEPLHLSKTWPYLPRKVYIESAEVEIKHFPSLSQENKILLYDKNIMISIILYGDSTT